jgi:hypothetical protein
MTSGTDDRPGRWLDAQLHLLDRQVLDVDDVPVAVVESPICSAREYSAQTSWVS